MRAKIEKWKNGENISFSYDDLREYDLHLYRSLCKEILENCNFKGKNELLGKIEGI
jgi:hypothetical protein